MITVKCRSNYDKSTNLSYISLDGTPKSEDDIIFWIKKFTVVWKGDGIHKCWCICDLRKMGKAHPKLVRYYHRLSNKIINKYVEDYIVIAETTLEKIAIRLFNALRGENHPIVSTMDEAMKIIEKWQEEKGVFPSNIE